MCLLVVRIRVVPGAPLVLGANRDEAIARPFDGPRLHAGTPPFLAPVDREAGGTWLGVNGAGLAIAVTNRPQREVVPTRRSRGLLAADALRAASPDRLRAALERHLRGGAPYNNFHLLAATVDEAFVLRYDDGWLQFTDLDAGDHFLTNHDELDLPRVPAIAAPPASGPAAEADRLMAALASHDAVLPGGRAVCKHDEDRGTVSAAVLALPGEGGGLPVFRFAAGPPCTAPAEDHSAALASLLA